MQVLPAILDTMDMSFRLWAHVRARHAYNLPLEYMHRVLGGITIRSCPSCPAGAFQVAKTSFITCSNAASISPAGTSARRHSRSQASSFFELTSPVELELCSATARS